MELFAEPDAGTALGIALGSLLALCGNAMAVPDRPSLSVTVPSSLTPGIPAATLNSAARSAGDASDSRSRSPT